MGFFGDLSASIYDIRHYLELSRRSAGRVIATFALVVVAIGLISGFWYVRSAGDLIGVVTDELKQHLPDIAIENGILSSPVEQPYIVTDEDLTPEFFQALQTVLSNRFHVSQRNVNVQSLYDELAETGENLFAFVLDTSDTYLDEINPNDYQVAVIVNDRAVRIEGQGVKEVQEQRFAELALPSPIALTPELVDTERAKQLARGYLSSFLPLLTILGMLVTYGIATLLIGAIGYVAALLSKREIDFAQAYKMSVYALVPVTIVNIVRVVMFGMPWLIPVLVHLAYVLVPVYLAPRLVESAKSKA